MTETTLLDRPPFSWIIGSLIIFSVICFSVETLPDLESQSRVLLRQIEMVTVTLFTIEYLARVYLAPNRLRYVFSFMGIVDLVAILPFYLSLFIDLRVLRLLRLLRFIRLLKFVRYDSAFSRFGKALLMAREELVIFMIASFIVFYLAAVGIFYFEHPAQPEVYRSVFDSLWWAIATLTTVGYGDIYPITAGGKAFTFLVLMVGLGLVAVPAGIVASTLSAVRRQEEREADPRLKSAGPEQADTGELQGADRLQ